MDSQSFAMHGPKDGAVSDTDGVRASNQSLFKVPEGLETEPWTAKWLWLSPERHPNLQETSFSSRKASPGDAYAVARFKRSFTMDKLPQEAALRVSADRKYRLFLNGRLIARGPAEPGGDYALNEHLPWWLYDSIPCEELLQSGENLIEAEVALQTGIPADLSNGRGGFILELLVRENGKWKPILASDGSWNCAVDKAFVAKGRYDARLKLGQGSEWEEACEIADAVNATWPLTPSKLPQMMECELKAKSVKGHFEKEDAIMLRDGDALEADFGRVFSGFGCLELEAEPGVEISIEYGEVPWKLHAKETYISKGRLQRFRSFCLNSIRHLRLTAKGGGARIAWPKAVFSSFPLEWRGSFESSDKNLDKYWELGRHATQICMQAYHMDSPLHQEELGCTGDYMIESAISYACFGEARLAEADIDRTARLLKMRNYEMFHTSYSLMWALMLKEHYQYAGDLNVVRRHADTLKALLRRFSAWRGANGLVTECPSFMFMDWLEMAGFELHHPPCVIGQGYMSALFHWALIETAELAIELGDDAWAKELQDEAADLRSAFIKVLWNGERGLFRDGVAFARKAPSGSMFIPADRDIESYTVHTNVMAALSGMLKKEDAKALLANALADQSLIEPQPYFHYFTLLAIQRFGLFESHALKLMESWGRMLHGGLNTWREAWSMGDYSHAWCSAPTLQLSKGILGFKVLKAGCAKIELSPCIATLGFMKTSIPLPQGRLTIDLQRDEKLLKIFIESPCDCSIKLKMPGYAMEHEASRSYSGDMKAIELALMRKDGLFEASL